MLSVSNNVSNPLNNDTVMQRSQNNSSPCGASLAASKDSTSTSISCWFEYVLAWGYFRAVLKWAAGLPEADEDRWIYSARVNEIHGSLLLTMYVHVGQVSVVCFICCVYVCCLFGHFYRSEKIPLRSCSAQKRNCLKLSTRTDLIICTLCLLWCVSTASSPKKESGSALLVIILQFTTVFSILLFLLSLA